MAYELRPVVTGREQVTSVAAIGDDLVVCGNFEGTAPAGAAVPAQGGRDPFVARLDPTGQPRWTRVLASAGFEACFAIAVSPSGELVAVGDFDLPIDFGAGPHTSDGPVNGFVVGLDAGDGTTTFSAAITGNGNVHLSGVAFTASGRLFVAGNFNVDLTLGALSRISVGGSDMFVAELLP
jgi:hypothetical protein